MTALSTITRWPHRVRTSKSPVEELDYVLDWSDWLEFGETIVDSEWSSSAGEITNTEETEDSATAWLSGGEIGDEITLTNVITTSNVPVARVAERSLIIKIESK